MVDFGQKSEVVRWRHPGSTGLTDEPGVCGAAANNGNVMGQSIGIPGVELSYAYDPLNRLSRVEEGTESRDFAYDAFGNMWVANASSGFARDSFTPATSAWFDANNRLTNAWLGVQHDNAGNLTAIGGFLYEYNADGMMTKATPSIGSATEYRYDGEGRRVTKQTGTEPVTTFVYDAFGGLAAEYGTAPAETGTHYIKADHLGSTRLVTDATGAVISRHDYLPFGEEIGADGTTRTTAMKYVLNEDLTQRFTGKERDTETGLDYFGARYFSGAQGRFTSADPKQFTAHHLLYPQKWNKYAYVQNNPLVSIDPDGLDDYKVFVAAPQAANDRAWRQAERVARASGHTLQVFSGDSGPMAASVEKWNRAVGDPNSRAIFIGHTTHDQNGTNGIQLANGISAGTVSQTTDQATSATITAVTVNANTVGLFGCDTKTIAGQYTADNPNTSVIAVDSGADKSTSLEALGAAAPAFVAADAAARPANGAAPANPANPVAAANDALQRNKRKEDQNERIVQH